MISKLPSQNYHQVSPNKWFNKNTFLVSLSTRSPSRLKFGDNENGGLSLNKKLTNTIKSSLAQAATSLSKASCPKNNLQCFVDTSTVHYN